jgi:hypothetical protein
MPPSTPPPRQKIKPPVVSTEQVLCSCGHAAAFELFADKVDKFRAGRRKKLTDRPCPACRQKAHLERMANDQAAIAERAKLRPPQPSRPGKNRLPIGRLPDGAAFAVAYDGKAERWRGTLTIPAADGRGAQTFTSEASAVFRLLTKLDEQYRQQAAVGLASDPAP